MAALTPIKQRFWDNDNNLLAGGKVYVYLAGTTTPTTSYTDSTGATPNTNPVILDSKGEAQIWTTTTVKIDVFTSADVQVTGYPVDYVGYTSDAGLIVNTPAGNIVATTVQAAINELDTDKASASSGTFTITGTGFTVNPTATARYAIVNGVCILSIPYAITGTSNATTFTMTGMPAACVPTYAVIIPIAGGANDNSAYTSNSSFRILAGSNVITMEKVVQSGGSDWTASGTKSLLVSTFCYNLN